MSLPQLSPDEEIEIYVTYFTERKLIKFPKTCVFKFLLWFLNSVGIVSKALVLICNYIAVDRIEACGLCFPDQKDGVKQKKHKMKDGAYRDSTVWLDANHSFQYYLDKQLIQAYVLNPYS